MAQPVFREASGSDADTVAGLHAESWRRHYRGAYAEAFLDGDVFDDRSAVWKARLRSDDPPRLTLLASDGGRAVGFANVYFDDDPAWGALLDNLHVADAWRGRGIGARLLGLCAQATLKRPGATGLHLWVLEQNTAARGFYEALGATESDREPVTPPGGVPGRLAGTPYKLRCAWPHSGLERLALRAPRS